jgi:hypothetical protein
LPSSFCQRLRTYTGYPGHLCYRSLQASSLIRTTCLSLTLCRFAGLGLWLSIHQQTWQLVSVRQIRIRCCTVPSFSPSFFPFLVYKTQKDFHPPSTHTLATGPCPLSLPTSRATILTFYTSPRPLIGSTSTHIRVIGFPTTTALRNTVRKTGMCPNHPTHHPLLKTSKLSVVATYTLSFRCSSLA